MVVRKGITLPSTLKTHVNVFTNELHSMKDIRVKICIKSDSMPKMPEN